MKTNRVLILVLLVALFLRYEAQAFYNPSTGRWLSRDPLGERVSRNVNAMVENRPTYRFDALGLKTISLVVGFDSSAEANARTKRILEKERMSLFELLMKCRKLKDCDCPNLKGDPIKVKLRYDEERNKEAPDDLDYDLGPGSEDRLLKDKNLDLVKVTDEPNPTARVLATRCTIDKTSVSSSRATTNEKGILFDLNSAYGAYYRTLAHEIGHVAGYKRPDNPDDDDYAPEGGNLMFWLGGTKPDCQWCQKVSNLAK